MAPVQSRLVLAVTIPAAALAIFLSLLWLRRTSKGHPPSPPDKENKEAEVICAQSDTLTSPGDDIATVQRAHPVEPLVTDLENKVSSQDKTEDRPALTPDEVPLKLDLVCIAPIEETKVNVDSRFACGEHLTDKKDTPSAAISVIGSGEDAAPESILNSVVCKEGASPLPLPEEKVVSSKVAENQSVPPKQNSFEAKVETDKVQPGKKEESTPTADKIMTKEMSVANMETDKETEVEKSDLSEKLVHLELDTMKLGDVEVKERDSANHSPSENMLASPSMSNFSDAHSEGSSDSGKGHSDGTTSPSRTPAGGSSVSGDPSPSIYEFVIPQVIVGRLIGRYGVFLNEIMSETHTSIFIKVHPETVKLKICAIEGSQQDIDKALEKIRKKFPLRRYPKLTLERVSFVPMQSSQQLRAEDFHLQLIEGVNNDVILSSLLSPGQFFVQLQCQPSYPCLTPLTQALTQAYSTTDAPALVSPVADAICVCPSMGGWYRAQIVSVDEDGRHCEIKFVDYGGYLKVDTCLLKQIRADFLMLPFQAVECSLANVMPTQESGWSEEARLFVHNITFGRILQAQIISYTETGIPLVNLYTGIDNQVVLVNAELVSNGYATYTNVGEEQEGVVGIEAAAAAEVLPTPAADQATSL